MIKNRNRARFFLLIIAVLILLSVILISYKQYFIFTLSVIILLAIIIGAGKKSAMSYFEKSILNFIKSSRGRVSRSQIVDYFKENSSKMEIQKIEDTITEALKNIEEKGLVRIESRKGEQEIITRVGVHTSP